MVSIFIKCQVCNLPRKEFM